MPISVALEALPPRATLERWWRELEASANHTFYTSWSWIGNWLAILPDHLQPHLLVARQAGRRVGLGIMVKGHAHLLQAVPVPCWYLHATGQAELDGLTIEYNGFLVERELASPATAAMLRHLMYRTGVKRLEIAKAQSLLGTLAHAAPDDLIVRSTEAVSYVVDLAQVRAAGGDSFSVLSANTRSQIRRSMQAYACTGALVVDEARTSDEAHRFLTALRSLHSQTWSERGVASSFASSPLARRFHDGIIDDAFTRGEVQLLRIRAGQQDIGYLYNFVHQGRVVFYQSGFHYGLLDKHDRPGLVCHKLAIDHNVRAGHALYDFAAGDYRYKASLATHREAQGSHVFQRKGVLTRLDSQLRTTKQCMARWHASARRWLARDRSMAWGNLLWLPSADMQAECAELGTWLLRLA